MCGMFLVFASRNLGPSVCDLLVFNRAVKGLLTLAVPCFRLYKRFGMGIRIQQLKGARRSWSV